MRSDRAREGDGVANYTCPNCGGTVTEDNGCNRCGAPYDSDVAALALFKRTVASLEAKKRSLVQQQLLLRTQLAHASAQRDSLVRKVRQKDHASRGATTQTAGQHQRVS